MIRLLTRLFYGCIVLDNFRHSPPDFASASGAALTPAGFGAAVAEGRLVSGSPEVAYAFGRMSLAAFVAGLEVPGFRSDLEGATGS